MALPMDRAPTGTVKSMKALVRRTTATYDGVIGDADARNLLLCTSPTEAVYSYPAVLPANMQSYPYDGVHIAQVGYLRCGKPSGGCGDAPTVPNDGTIHFVYTPIDNCDGCFTSVDSWYGGPPVVGHRYRFKITNHLQPNQWIYCIRDVTAGTSEKCTSKTATFTQGGEVWFGTEVHNTNAGLGPNDPARIHMYWMQYSKVNDPSWLVTTNNAMLTNGGPLPSKYWCWIYNQNYTGDAMESVSIAGVKSCPGSP